MSVFPNAFMTEDQVRQEMMDAGGKLEFTKKTSERMRALEQSYGGTRSDIPLDPNHEYWQLEEKLRLANRVDVPLQTQQKLTEQDNERK